MGPLFCAMTQETSTRLIGSLGDTTTTKLDSRIHRVIASSRLRSVVDDHQYKQCKVSSTTTTKVIQNRLLFLTGSMFLIVNDQHS
jgi:hypothetical protein